MLTWLGLSSKSVLGLVVCLFIYIINMYNYPFPHSPLHLCNCNSTFSLSPWKMVVAYGSGPLRLAPAVPECCPYFYLNYNYRISYTVPSCGPVRLVLEDSSKRQNAAPCHAIVVVFLYVCSFAVSS